MEAIFRSVRGQAEGRGWAARRMVTAGRADVNRISAASAAADRGEYNRPGRPSIHYQCVVRANRLGTPFESIRCQRVGRVCAVAPARDCRGEGWPAAAAQRESREQQPAIDHDAAHTRRTRIMASMSIHGPLNPRGPEDMSTPDYKRTSIRVY
jgi:hypothetical protein